MTTLEIQWPDAAAERVRAARGKLSVASEALRRMPFADRLRRVTQVLESWTAIDSPWRRELIGSLAEADSPFHRSTLTEGIDSALRAWDPSAFQALAEREIGALLQPDRTRLAPFETISVLAGGALPMPTLSSILFPLVVGSPVLLRETQQDPVTGKLVARSLAAIDEALAPCLECVRFPHEDEAALAEFLASPCVVATGSNETIRTLRARLRPDQRFVAYGHRFSVAVFGSEILEAPAALQKAAEGLALDIARWDQSGCLSPALLYVVGLDPAERMTVAERLAHELDRVSESLPRGPVSPAAGAAQATERAEARMRAAADPTVRLIEGPDSTVVLEADARPRPAPLGRLIRMHPVESLAALGKALHPFDRQLSNAAIAGFSDREKSQLHFLLETKGINRITAPGTMQTPPIDWPHDGLTILQPLARFIQSEI